MNHQDDDEKPDRGSGRNPPATLWCDHECVQGRDHCSSPNVEQRQRQARPGTVSQGNNHHQPRHDHAKKKHPAPLGIHQLVPKHSRRLEGFNQNIVHLYARGLSSRDIRRELARMYGVEVSPALISRVTDGIIEELNEWQHRPLDAVYPILYIDALVVKIRTQGTVVNRAAYLGVGVDVAGRKHVLGVWLGDGGEGAKFWLAVLTEIRNRGVTDVLIVCCDGLKGLPDAIEAT